MQRTYSWIDKIRAELSWVTETTDPNKCGCRNLRCCRVRRHESGGCSRAPCKKLTFRWEYFCGTRLVGPTPAKLPVGIDFAARPFDEPTLFKIASAYERATKHRMPPPEFGPLPKQSTAANQR